MITTEEAQSLISRIAASNIVMRQLILNVLTEPDSTEVDRVLQDNAKALKEFATAHPETLGSADQMMF